VFTLAFSPLLQAEGRISPFLPPSSMYGHAAYRLLGHVDGNAARLLLVPKQLHHHHISHGQELLLDAAGILALDLREGRACWVRHVACMGTVSAGGVLGTHAIGHRR
jgi:hypothetical protein